MLYCAPLLACSCLKRSADQRCGSSAPVLGDGNCSSSFFVGVVFGLDGVGAAGIEPGTGCLPFVNRARRNEEFGGVDNVSGESRGGCVGVVRRVESRTSTPCGRCGLAVAVGRRR